MKKEVFTVVGALLALFAVAAYSLWGLANKESADSDKAYAMVYDAFSAADSEVFIENLKRIKTPWWREYALSRIYAADDSVPFDQAAKSLKNSEFIAYVYAAKSLKDPNIKTGKLSLGIRDLMCAQLLKKIWSGGAVPQNEVKSFAFNSFSVGDEVLRRAYGDLFLREIVKTRRFDLIPVFNSVFKYDMLNLALSLSRLGAEMADFKSAGENYEQLLNMLYESSKPLAEAEKSKLKGEITSNFKAISGGRYLWRRALLAQVMYDLGDESGAVEVFDNFYSDMMSPPAKHFQWRQEARDMAFGFAVRNRMENMAREYLRSAPTKEFRLKILAGQSFLMSRYMGAEKAFNMISAFSE